MANVFFSSRLIAATREHVNSAPPSTYFQLESVCSALG
jgi:hypothetical protein